MPNNITRSRFVSCAKYVFLVTQWIIVFAHEMKNMLIVRCRCRYRWCVCVFRFVCLLETKRSAERKRCCREREMYHHYGMDVIVSYCWTNTAVYISLLLFFARIFLCVFLFVGNKLRYIFAKMIHVFLFCSFLYWNVSIT